MALSVIAESNAYGARRIMYKETAVDPASTGTMTTVVANVTVAGITTADKIISAQVNATLSSAGAMLTGAQCQATNNVRFTYSNPSAGTVDIAAHEVVFEVLKLS